MLNIGIFAFFSRDIFKNDQFKEIKQLHVIRFKASFKYLTKKEKLVFFSFLLRATYRKTNKYLVENLSNSINASITISKLKLFLLFV